MASVLNGKARFKIQRRLGLELPGLGKAGALERRAYGPGQHGMKRKKLSDFTIRLVEKQKIIFHYLLKEKQLVNYVKKAKKDKSRAWVDALMINLERRLDNIVFRCNFAPSMAAARQMVRHGHILINGKKVNLPGVVLKVGDQITLTDKGFKSQSYQYCLTNPRFASVPGCYNILDGAEGKKTIKVLDNPLAEDIPFEFDGRLVTEYYWKVKA